MPVKFSLKTLLNQSVLLALAFAIVFNYGESIYAHFVVSALYSLVISVTNSRRNCLRNGTLGAILGWAISMLLSIGIQLIGYLNYAGDAPYFDGDGPMAGLIYLPLFAFFCLPIPLGIMGVIIGLLSYFAQSQAKRIPASIED